MGVEGTLGKDALSGEGAEFSGAGPEQPVEVAAGDCSMSPFKGDPGVYPDVGVAEYGLGVVKDAEGGVKGVEAEADVVDAAGPKPGGVPSDEAGEPGV